MTSWQEYFDKLQQCEYDKKFKPVATAKRKSMINHGFDYEWIPVVIGLVDNKVVERYEYGYYTSIIGPCIDGREILWRAQKQYKEYFKDIKLIDSKEQ